jgi:Arc/MetJ-type ribon-helix-helix transcriptional regulator
MASPISLPTDVQSRVQSFIDSGKFASEVDVLRAALDSLELESADVRSIQAGIDDMNAGRCRPFAEFASDFEARRAIV